jgi:hypothetical protein
LTRLKPCPKFCGVGLIGDFWMLNNQLHPESIPVVGNGGGFGQHVSY